MVTLIEEFKAILIDCDMLANDMQAYDLDGMLIDYNNGNFNPDTDSFEEYNKVTIVGASIINGQKAQAKEQAAEFELDYDTIRESVESIDNDLMIDWGDDDYPC